MKTQVSNNCDLRDVFDRANAILVVLVAVHLHSETDVFKHSIDHSETKICMLMLEAIQQARHPAHIVELDLPNAICLT